MCMYVYMYVYVCMYMYICMYIYVGRSLAVELDRRKIEKRLR